MQQKFFSQEHDALLTKSKVIESQGFLKKKLGVQKCCVCEAKPIVATIETVTSTISLARDSMKELWKTVEIDPCQSIAKC